VAIVVSDTSPIRALHHLHLLNLLEAIYGKVYLPDAVAQELRRPSRRFPAFEAQECQFILIESPRDQGRVRALEEDLDDGEASALVLALERSADYVLIDEREGRRIARSLGLTVVGVLGVLLEAKRRKLIPTMRPLVERLQVELDFRLTSKLVAEVLKQAGE
jgi:uncharacterized protein